MKNHEQYKNSRRIQFNLGNNYSDLYVKKKSISKLNKNSNNTALTNTSISSQNEKENDEKILLSTGVKSKKRFTTTNKYAVLTCLKLCFYNSKDNYLLDKENKENLYKVFNLKEFSFEISNNTLIIQRKEDNNRKNDTKNLCVEKYEFNSPKTANKWYETILENINLINMNNTKKNIEKNKYLKNHEEYSFNKNEIEKNGDDEPNTNTNDKENNKLNNINKNNNNCVNNVKIYSEISESNYQSNISYIKEEEDENNKDSDNEKDNGNDNVDIKENEKNIISNDVNLKEINSKPSFRCLLKKVIKKVEKELFNNNVINNNSS